jgi:hypothetical protein
MCSGGNEELLRGFNDVFEKLMRRYKYLLKVFQNHTSTGLNFLELSLSVFNVF